MPELSAQLAGEPTGPGDRPVKKVAVLGSSGFVGRAVVAELRSREAEVHLVSAPRLSWPVTESLRSNSVPADLQRNVVDALAAQLDGAHVVINTAGLPNGSAPDSAELYGGNALLPTLVARASALVNADRLVHVSSAAAQGAMDLDETSRTMPFSPYSRSKAVGERLLQREDCIDTVIYRSTWVHDVARPNTRALIRLAQSRMSCVAGDGTAPTPQVLIDDVAAAITHLGLVDGPVPPIVLQPHNGMTTGLLLRLLGGREPLHLPPLMARYATRCVTAYGRTSLTANAHARRVDMLLFGKRQTPGWLAEQGLVPRLRPEAWERLRTAGAHPTSASTPNVEAVARPRTGDPQPVETSGVDAAHRFLTK
ncbi:NAD-dependent epimerase/dehydratase family protein [Micromonospora sp. WMMD1155]|uniref:NAD-dependent epimerase/dehydratase family protein n=1 Tax=Micromonospora sp. WMMD1155 TaxID=3016094 RepID=UPI00249C8562|nr:NAD-dependent epimerase/dehydratase family protein [Micromonospora sp. WMMD1155]WFE49200.1 NAD-dependent epimerase/dehydratase family protein [Micromonospora sp. WMMD1155]